MGVGGQHHAPAALPPGKTWYPLYRRLGRPQGRSGRVRKISPLPGFDHRTVQSVASRYTDRAIAAHSSLIPPRLFSSFREFIFIYGDSNLECGMLHIWHQMCFSCRSLVFASVICGTKNQIGFNTKDFNSISVDCKPFMKRVPQILI